MEKKWGPRAKLKEVASAKDLRSSPIGRRKVRRAKSAGSHKNQEQTVVVCCCVYFPN